MNLSRKEVRTNASCKNARRRPQSQQPRRIPLLRLLSYLKKYTPTLVLVLVCILLASVAQAQGSRALGPLVDDYILPMVESGSTDFSPPVWLSRQAGLYLRPGHSGLLPL